jgi:tetratricopeptide (TPR) repeat protein
LEELAQDEAAIQTYRKAIELTQQQNLKDEKAYLHLGKFYSRTGRYQEGLPFLEKAVDLNPKSAEAFFLLGKVLNHLGDSPRAQAALEQSVQNDPRYPDPHYLLSRIHLKRGRQEDAAKEMQLYREARKLQIRKDDGRRAVR